MKSHENKVVLVTGAGRGIGQKIAEAFAGAGAAVGVLDFDYESSVVVAGEIQSKGQIAFPVQADVARFGEVKRACAQIGDRFGRINILINNAGISPKKNGTKVDAAEMDEEEWRRVIDVNLTGCFNAVRVVAPEMKARKEGSIVNMSSVAGRAFCSLVGIHYSTSKAALIGFTRHLAGELGPCGITVNAIAPGRIDTPMMRMVAGKVNEEIVEQTPLRRLGLPQDVANLALFLTSEKGNFITGQVCDVSGGWLMT